MQLTRETLVSLEQFHLEELRVQHSALSREHEVAVADQTRALDAAANAIAMRTAEALVAAGVST